MTQQNMFGVPRIFVPEPKDWERWSGHKRKMFEFLRDGRWHNRDAIVEYVGTKGFTGRISDLRQRGYVIECQRATEGGGTIYRILEYTGVSTTKGGHCPSCTCGASR